MSKKILDSVNKYYTEKIQEYGRTSQGVDWNGDESHHIRFDQLIKVFSDNCKDFSLLDYGCGFGSLIEFLNGKGVEFQYLGFDISEKMVENAKELYGDKYRFTSSLTEIDIFDYAIANGIFNVKLDCSEEDWIKYILKTLNELNARSKRGFSFNVLTKYSEREYMRDYLYYADTTLLFDYCKKNFSRNVALLHDYDLYEFTIIVRK